MAIVRLIGYWRPESDTTFAYPHPSDWVDWGWDGEERSIVGGYFASGTLLRGYMGTSPCRICGRPNGAAEYADGTYVWPEGLAHYVDEHAVRLPAEVVAHAMSRSGLLEGATVAADWWLEQSNVRGESVSSASSPHPELPTATHRSGAEPMEHHTAGDDDLDGNYLASGSVWLAMAQLLIADGGHRILSATAQGRLSLVAHVKLSRSGARELTGNVACVFCHAAVRLPLAT